MYRVIILSIFLYIASFQLIYANCTSQISSLEQGVGTGFSDGIDGPYIDNSDGTVTDQGTGLMWQKTDQGVEGQGHVTWDAACQHCDNLTIANHSDWKVPDVIQLQTLIDDGYDPSINTNYFASTKTTDAYWTASTFTDYSSDAWLIYFSDGSVNHDDKNSARYVRCVRTASSGSNTDLSFSTAVDSTSGDIPFVATFTSLILTGTPEYTYSWDFGDGSSSSDPSPVHTYTTAGTYTATLTVVDSGGKSAYKSITITVGSTNTSDSIVIWANSGGDKVTQDELRANTNSSSVINGVWDGQKISIFGARNEVIEFNLILEAPIASIKNVAVSFNTLSGPSGSNISSVSATGNGVFNWVNRNIELFYIRYLEIKGVSTDIFFHGFNYDERHIPERFRRPWTGEGDGTGTWEDRPDRNKFYPDIAVPLELVSKFNIAAGQNQSIWVDIYIPKTTQAGLFTGTVSISENGTKIADVPVELTVKNFSLPDLPTARTMLYFSNENINERYLGNSYVEEDTPEYTQSLELIDTHFQLAHRHRISLIDNYIESERMNDAWTSRLNGTLFTSEKGYAGPGVGVGNNVYSIGTYSSWPWFEGTKEQMWTNTDTWVDYFDSQAFTTPTEYFLYLIDEALDFGPTEQWAQWMASNPGSGSRLMSMATLSLPNAVASTPSLNIPTSWVPFGIPESYQSAADSLKADSSKLLYLYNGGRPGCGTFAIEDEGVSPRVIAWTHYKMKADRWFYWESTYYNNYQAGEGETNVFQRAQCYGSFDRTDESLGETGWNYLNGDGVLFYPGTDTQYPSDSYGVAGPFASLRLKYWRRGLQDYEYLIQAAAINPTQTTQIANKMIPKVAWEVRAADDTETWAETDISWSTDPEVWEAARLELAEIIEQKNPDSEDCFIILSDGSMATITSGTDCQIIGNHENNSVTLESGTIAKLLNFPGTNTIWIESNSTLFTVSRSGATVTFAGSDGTILKMPATTTTQHICFNDRTLDLVINSGAVMLDAQIVGTQAVGITQSNYPIIIDHTDTDISQIPGTWLDVVKNRLKVSYGHTSHGSQPITGMEVLENANLTYSFTTDGSVASGILSIDDYTPSGDLGQEGDISWANLTRAYLNNSGSDRNVVIWSWCGGVSDNTKTGIQAYLNAMTQLESEFPNVTFVYMTGHLDGTGSSGNLNQRNNQIRQYCQANNKVLFDFADIESYAPDGTSYLGQDADDGCYYYGNMSGNWAQEWCAANSGDSLCNTCDCAHSQSLNCNLKARAFWWMLARVAGWNGQ